MLNLMLFFRTLVRSTFLIGAIFSVTCGCALTVPSDQNAEENQSAIDEKRVPAQEIWRQLGSAIKHRTIRKTAQLAQVVLVLVKNGDLSELDATQFDTTFPNVTTADRDLTDADVLLLESLK